jgi:signal transduction histidine kinase
VSKWVSILLSVCLLPSWLYGQDPYYRLIDASDGLPSNSVYGLFQDSQGFIWIATDDGLCRYDGHSFQSYTATNQSSRAGSNIFEDSFGRIWYENFDGRLYYVQGDTLAGLADQDAKGYVRAGHQGERLYVPSGDGLLLTYSLRTLHRQAPVTLGDNSSFGVGRKGSRYYWLYGKEMHFGIDSSGKVLHVPSFSDPAGPRWNVALDYLGRILLIDYTHPELGVRVWEQGQLRPFADLRSNSMVQTHELMGGRLWVCYTRGLEVIDVRSGAKVGQRTYFQDKSISAVLVDREGNHWFGTTNEGLLFVPDFSSQRIAFPQGGLSRLVTSGGDLILGTQEGSVLRYPHDGGQPTVVRRNDSRHAIDFLGLDGENIVDADPLAHFTRRDGDGANILAQAAFKDALRVSPRYLAISTPGTSGFFRLPMPGHTGGDPWDSIAQRHPNQFDKNLFDVFLGRGRAVAARPGDTTIFYATSNGLMRLRPRSKLELRWQGRTFYAGKLQADARHTFVLSTAGDFFIVEGDSLLSPVNEFPVGPPYSLMKLLDGKLYLLGRRQLLQLDISGPRPRLLNVLSGLQGDRINDIGRYQDRLALATDDGLLLLDPDQKADALPPRFYITALRISGQAHAPDSLIEVGYEKNEIVIQYAILSYSTGGDYPLYYRIQGGEWRKADPDTRQLLLARLAPGDYAVEFCLGAPATDIVATVRIRIQSPFWMKAWFYVLCLLLLAALVAGLLWRRGRRQQARQAQHLEKLELENSLRLSTLTAIRSQMNPHFFFNALNTIQAFIFGDDKRNAINYLGKFSKLTRLILEMSEKELVALGEEVQVSTLYLELEKSRFGDDFQFQIQVGPGLSLEMVALPSMIIQPFVENAVKHGLLHQTGSKELRVSFFAEGDTLVIEIDDNGIGRKRSEELNRIRMERHRSFAVTASQKRIDLLNTGHNRIGVVYTDKMDAQGRACGTTVKVSLPLQHHTPE